MGSEAPHSVQPLMVVAVPAARRDTLKCIFPTPFLIPFGYRESTITAHPFIPLVISLRTPLNWRESKKEAIP